MENQKNKKQNIRLINDLLHNVYDCHTYVSGVKEREKEFIFFFFP